MSRTAAWLLVMAALVTSADPLVVYQWHGGNVTGDDWLSERVDSEHAFIFIGGLHQSGTTFVHHLLATHPNVSGFFHTRARVAQDEGQHLQSVFPPDDGLDFTVVDPDPRVACGIERGVFPAPRAGAAATGYAVFASAAQAHLTEQSPLASAATAAALWDDWRREWRLQRRWLVEKSPPTVVRTRFLQALFGAQRTEFLLVLRHPVALAKLPPRCRSVAVVEDYIRQFILVWRYWLPHDAGHLRKCTVVRFEDLLGSFDLAHRLLFAAMQLPPHNPITIEHNSITHNSIPHNSITHNSITEHNPTEHNPTEHNPTEYNPTEYNPTEHNAMMRQLLAYHGEHSPTSLTINVDEQDDWHAAWQLLTEQCQEETAALRAKYDGLLAAFGYSLAPPYTLDRWALHDVFADSSVCSWHHADGARCQPPPPPRSVRQQADLLALIDSCEEK